MSSSQRSIASRKMLVAVIFAIPEPYNRYYRMLRIKRNILHLFAHQITYKFLWRSLIYCENSEIIPVHDKLTIHEILLIKLGSSVFNLDKSIN